MKTSRILAVVTSGCLFVVSAGAGARNYDFYIDTLPESIAPVDQQQPEYPDTGIRSGQEGWVQVHFVITPDGRATDPVVVDSVGGAEFEMSARDAVALWTFEPTGEWIANAQADIRYEIYRGRDLATSNFLRRYRVIARNLYNEEFAEAREKVNEAAELGGWNLYEETMLWLMIGRVEGAEGNEIGKLEAYRRALRIGNRAALNRDNRQELLRQTFELEMGQSQFSAAQATLAALQSDPGSQDDLDEIAGLVETLNARINADVPIVARATLFNAADSPDGVPLWFYVPLRKTFSFDAPNGNVERFEVRCERDRLEGPVEPGKTWTLPENARNCRLFVFGDDGASFDFVEYPETHSLDANAKAAVAINHVLDRRSRR